MNSKYNIDLSLTPTTLDIFHISLIGIVFLLSILLIFVLLTWVISLSRKTSKKGAETVVQQIPQATEPQVKIVEKIVEVEKIVPASTPEPVILKESSPDAALQLLGLLQKEARLIDFIKEDVTNYTDAEIGAAARVVHEGCKKTINEHFTLTPIRSEQENTRITLTKDFDASSVRLTGNIVGKPPFTGNLIHKGWQIKDIRLPKITEKHNVNIVAAAEVEL